MSALVLVQGRTTDAERYLIYRDAATPTLLKYGGTPVVQAGGDNPSAVTALEGEVAEGVTILQFVSKEAALAWYDSPEYTAARELRRDAVESPCWSWKPSPEPRARWRIGNSNAIFLAQAPRARNQHQLMRSLESDATR